MGGVWCARSDARSASKSDHRPDAQQAVLFDQERAARETSEVFAARRHDRSSTNRHHADMHRHIAPFCQCDIARRTALLDDTYSLHRVTHRHSSD